jgi:hypothetical protein
MPEIKAIEPESGRSATLEVPEAEETFYDSLNKKESSDSAIRRTIDGLNISADQKTLLYKFSQTTLLIGDRVVKIGRAILEYTCKLFAEFPNTAFGIVLGGIAGALFSAIPGLGQLLGPIVSPILVFLGFLGGIFIDFKERLISKKIASHVADQNRRLAEQIDLKIREVTGLEGAP